MIDFVEFMEPSVDYMWPKRRPYTDYANEKWRTVTSSDNFDRIYSNEEAAYYISLVVYCGLEARALELRKYPDDD